MRSKKWTALVLGALIGVNAAAASAQVVVQVRPPRAVVERRSSPPGRGYVWVPGYQRWDGRAYGWVPGRWEIPPRPRAHWVGPKWERQRNGWVFREGRWR